MLFAAAPTRSDFRYFSCGLLKLNLQLSLYHYNGIFVDTATIISFSYV